MTAKERGWTLTSTRFFTPSFKIPGEHFNLTHQISELEIVKHLKISFFGLFFFLVQLPPEAID
jgi:hypothetical protein